jgi:hypothetical protein
MIVCVVLTGFSGVASCNPVPRRRSQWRRGCHTAFFHCFFDGVSASDLRARERRRPRRLVGGRRCVQRRRTIARRIRRGAGPARVPVPDGKAGRRSPPLPLLPEYSTTSRPFLFRARRREDSDFVGLCSFFLGRRRKCGQFARRNSGQNPPPPPPSSHRFSSSPVVEHLTRAKRRPEDGASVVPARPPAHVTRWTWGARRSQ